MWFPESPFSHGLPPFLGQLAPTSPWEWQSGHFSFYTHGVEAHVLNSSLVYLLSLPMTHSWYHVLCRTHLRVRSTVLSTLRAKFSTAQWSLEMKSSDSINFVPQFSSPGPRSHFLHLFICSDFKFRSKGLGPLAACLRLQCLCAGLTLLPCGATWASSRTVSPILIPCIVASSHASSCLTLGEAG